MDKIVWLYYATRWKVNSIYKRLTKRNLLNTRKKYGKNRFVFGEEGNFLIKQRILRNEPFACCRFGISEIRYLLAYEEERIWGKSSSELREQAISTFELYPDDESKGYKKFAELMRHACENADFIGVWPYVVMGDYYVQSIKNVKEKVVGTALMVEPYYYAEPWSEALAGKRVLVINPFVEIMEKQYGNYRELLFEDENVLPKFELLTLPSVWYDASGKDPRFKNWFEAYDYLYEEAMKKEFDIALLGCGPFGFPLAVRFKEAGKQAIHIGGAIQILFGIIGKRWEKQEEFIKFFNEYWVRPEKPEMKLNYKFLDDGCYW